MSVAKLTLTKVKDSALAAMFSGRHLLTKTKDGNFFIDRDPDVFSLLVSYLRNGCRIPPITDLSLLQRLEIELDFWLLPPTGNSDCSELQNQLKLDALFESEPRLNQDCVALKKWKELGPFDYK